MKKFIELFIEWANVSRNRYKLNHHKSPDIVTLEKRKNKRIIEDWNEVLFMCEFNQKWRHSNMNETTE